MKKLLFTLVAMAMSLIAMAQTPGYLRVNTNTGDALVVSFDQQPEISFLADGIKVTANGMEEPVTFIFDDVDSIDFTSESSVNEVELDGDVIRLAAYPDRIVFLNVLEGSPLKVYSVSGQLLRSFDASGEATLYKSDFNRGVYVVTVGASSFKLSF